MNSVVGVVLARESLPGIAPVRGGMYDQSMAYIHGDVMVGASIQPLIEHHVSSLQLGRFDFCPVGGEPRSRAGMYTVLGGGNLGTGIRFFNQLAAIDSIAGGGAVMSAQELEGIFAGCYPLGIVSLR